MKRWFQFQTWELFLLTILVAVCAQCWSFFPEYIDTACIVAIWIATIFRLRIPLTAKAFAIHFGIMVLAIAYSLQYCISGAAGWWIAPFCSANGAVWGCMLSGITVLVLKLFLLTSRLVQRIRTHFRDRVFRENPGAFDLCKESDEVLASRTII